MTATLTTTTQTWALRLLNTVQDRAYLLAVAALVGVLLAVILPDAAYAKCQPEGVPDAAGSGVTGLLDHRSATMEGDSLYGDYGYSGLTWHACDLGGPIAGNEWAGDPDAMMDTKIGNAGLGLAKWLAAAATGLHSWNTNTGEVLQPLDDMIVKLSELTRTLVVDQWFIMFILLAAVMLFAWSFTKEVRKSMMTAGAFLASVGFLAVVGTAPLTVAHAIDDVGHSVTSTADQKALEAAGITAEPDEAMGAILNDQILYPLWAKGALGSDDQTAAGADTWATKLYKASATTYDETDVDPKDKKKDYEDIYNKLGKGEDKQLQQFMKGQGYNRAGVGLAALIQSGLVSAVRIASEALIFASKLIFRFIPIIGPIFAVLGVWHVTRGVAKEGLNMVGAAAINVIVFGVLAALHTTLIAFMAKNLDFAPMLFFSAIVTYIFWKFTKPFRSLTEMVSPSSVKQSMHGASNLNPMGMAMGAWALLNGNRPGKQSAPGSTRDVNAEDDTEQQNEEQSPRRRQHTTHTGPDYTPALTGTPATTAPALDPAPVPASTPVPVAHPEAAYPDEAPTTPRPAPAAEPRAELSAEPQAQQEDRGGSHAVDTADTEAANQRRDDHGERIMGDRIVAAIDRAASTHQAAQAQQGAPTPGVQRGEVLDENQEIPTDIVRMDRDANSGVYFNPRVDATTNTAFNQHIFVPGSQTYYERNDTESETVTRETQER